VLDTLWKKTLPSKLFHLERVARRPDNLPLQTTITSLSWREVTHRLNTNSHWPVSHAQSSSAWPQHPTGKQTRASRTGSTMAHGLTVLNSGKRATANPRQEPHRLEPLRQELYQGISEIHTGFSAFSGMNRRCALSQHDTGLFWFGG
jgi:hypothetical protein